MPLQLSFVTSAKRHRDLPTSPGEVAFVGRSNVGKSSLINALANRKQLAKVSNTPGRTQLLNMFALPNGASVVDLPGYGYAKVPGREKAGWQRMIEDYLLDREELELVFVLVDGEIGPTKLDVQMLIWLRENAVPVAAATYYEVGRRQPPLPAPASSGCSARGGACAAASQTGPCRRLPWLWGFTAWA